MKQIKIFIYLLIAVTIFSSCKKDFLTLYPEGNLNEGNFYKSTADFQQSLVGAYAPLRDVCNMAYNMDEIRADNTRYDYNAKDRGNALAENLTNFLDASDNPLILTRYQADYNGISRTNVILDRIATITFQMADADKNQIIGETKALRAYYYFDLVKNYGGVPLALHEVKSPNDAFLPRATADDTYKQIISDLKDAYGLLAAPTFSGPQSGRITKGTVGTVLGSVYLQMKDYASAIPYLKDVTAMGYSLYPVYRDIFNPANKNGNKEIIWDVQYQSGTTGQQSDFIYRFTPLTTNTLNILGVSFNNTVGGWNVPTDDLVSLFSTADQRFDASIGIVEGTIDANTNFNPTRVASVINYVPAPGTVAKYFIRKYYYPPYPNLYRNTDQNWPLYRYSDVKLMLAECLNETNKPGEALPYLNDVRSRAFGAGNGQITTLNQPALRDSIAKERRLELCFENKRYQDLIRTGQAITVLTAYGAKMKQQYGYLLPQTYNVTQNRLLYAIPLREIQLNPKLVQNPGYN
jgi:starch-binding outer membrane protein, SusD/RagB family